MAINIYYDISLNGAGTGTTSDPYTWNDATDQSVNYHYNLVNPDDNNLDFFIRGTRQASVNLGIGTAGSLRYLPWDLSLYGPWRIGDDRTDSEVGIGGPSNPGLTLDGAILKAETVNLGRGDFYPFTVSRTVVLANNIELFQAHNTPSNSGPTVYAGCSFIADGTLSIIPRAFDGAYNGDQYIDCIFNFADATVISGLLNPNPRADFTNCVLPSIVKHEADTTVNYSNSQTYWVPTPFPAWDDATPAHWGQKTLAVDIHTPPEPGITGYSGLWGEARTGIGALYFNGFPPSSLSYFADGSVTRENYANSRANLPVIVDRIHQDNTDSYFASPAEINRVIVYYNHEDGRQVKKVVHEKSDMNGYVAWLADARDGTWQKNRIKILDMNNAEHDLYRASIGAGEDLVFSDGTMTLNII
jgi:hypothetical protein